MINYYNENRISEVILSGGTEQNGTPSPDTPVDIVCNNGVLKVRHQSGLPLGYTLLDYIESTGTQFIVTPLNINEGSFSFECDFMPTSFNYSIYGAIFGIDTNYQAGISNRGVAYIGNESSPNNITFRLYQKSRVSGAVSTDASQTYFYVDGEDTGLHRATKKNSGTNRLFAASNNNFVKGRMYFFRATRNNSIIFNALPARRIEDDKVGMYDTITRTFFTNPGTGEFIAGDPVSDPVEIYTDGTQETVTVTGKNLFNVSDYSSSSDWQGSGSYKYVEIPLPNGTYTVSWDKTKGAPNIYWLIQVRESVAGTSNSGIGGSWLWHATAVGLQKEKFTFTVTEGKAWFSCAFNNFNKFLACLETVQIEPGSAATEYEPYFNGGTATAEMLLKVGDYTDTQKVIKGEVRRNVGIKVLDGTEAWVTIDGSRTWGYCYNLVVPLQNATAGINTNCYSTHFKAVNKCWDTATEPCFSFHKFAISGWTGKPFFVVEQDTIQKFKQWLADQYANGTPVIIVYPLEAPTTEEVDGQFLDGKYVEQISGAISNLPIEISNIHNLKKRYVTDSNGNATEITKIYKGDTLLWQK